MKYVTGAVRLLHVVLLLIIAAGAYYGYSVWTLAARSDQRGLILASLIREQVPGLRTPLYFPFHGHPPDTRKPADIALTSKSWGGNGGCGYALLQPCQAFHVSSQILERPEVWASLVRFLDKPCSSVRTEPGAAVAQSSDTSGAEARDRQITLDVAGGYFGCDGEAGRQGLLILNVVDAIDDATRFPKPIRFRLTKLYP